MMFRDKYPYVDNCTRCGIKFSSHTGIAVIVICTLVGVDETDLCGRCYNELVTPMAQIEIVRCGRSVDLEDLKEADI